MVRRDDDTSKGAMCLPGHESSRSLGADHWASVWYKSISQKVEGVFMYSAERNRVDGLHYMSIYREIPKKKCRMKHIQIIHIGRRPA